MPAGVVDGPLQRGLEAAAVLRPGQRVGDDDLLQVQVRLLEGLPLALELLGVPLPLGHVLGDADRRSRRAGGVRVGRAVVRLAAGADPADLAVRPQDAVLRGTAVGRRGGGVAAGAVAVVGVQRTAQERRRVGRGQERLGRPAPDAGEGAVDVGRARGIGVPEPDDFHRLVEEGREVGRRRGHKESLDGRETRGGCGELFAGRAARGRRPDGFIERERPRDRNSCRNYRHRRPPDPAHPTNSATGARSSRRYIGRPAPLGKVAAGSMPTAR